LAVRIRLQRHGRKKRPFYRLVAADARFQRDGRFLERLGHYNPLTDPSEVVIDEEKALKWLKRGAQPSDTAKNLLSQTGIWERFIAEKLGQPIPPPREVEPSSAPEAVDDSAKAEAESGEAPSEAPVEEADEPSN
jgi:small subunit ribosomal protein S16